MWEWGKSRLADWIQDQLVMPYGGLAPTWNATQPVNSELLAVRTHTGVLGRVFVDLWSRKTHVATAAIFTFLCTPVGTCSH